MSFHFESNTLCPLGKAMLALARKEGHRPNHNKPLRGNNTRQSDVTTEQVEAHIIAKPHCTMAHLILMLDCSASVIAHRISSLRGRGVKVITNRACPSQNRPATYHIEVVS